MFIKHCLYLLDTLGTLLLKDLITDSGGQNVGGYVPSGSGKRQYGKRDRYEACD
jgi:hypothetical protein